MPPRKPRHPRYSILRRLGHGGAGSVYLARDLIDDGREVALKVSHLDVAPEQILREFRILRELRHPSIARAHDFGRLPGDGRTYFTLEYVEGASLEKRLSELRSRARGGQLAEFLEPFVEILSALAYLHRKGLLHLDLKPANVIINGDRVTLIDFGLFENAHLDSSRQRRGTPRYVAPEVLEGAPVDARADLYSFGVTLHRALTGRYPASPIDSGRHGGAALGSSVPAPLAAVIRRLLARAPRHRFRSALEVIDALRAVEPRITAPEHGSPGEIGFVGRRRELDTFFEWLERLRDGSGPRVLLVEGESGIGKTRFADCCITEMLGLGVRVVPLRAFAGKDSDGLRRLVEKIAVLDQSRTPAGARFPFLFASLGLGADTAAREELARLDLDQIRARVSSEALELVEAAVETPCVLVLEDMHHADPQLLDFVDRLARRTAGEPIGVLATTQSASALAGSENSRAAFERIRLHRLRRKEIVEALREASVPSASRRATLLARRSRGIPRLLLRLLRGPVGDAESDADGVAQAGRRIERLGRDARSVVLHLGALERPADEKLVRDLTGLSRGEFQTARAALEEAGLLAGSPAGYYAPAMPPLEGDASGFSKSRVRDAHATIGLRLLEEPRTRGEAAHHLLRGGKIRRGLDAARQAVDELHASGRVEDALRLSTEALEHARSAAARRHFLEASGDLLEKSGQFDDAGGALDRLLSDARLPARTRVRALRKRGGICQRQGDSDSARGHFEEALKLLERVNDFEEHLSVLNELAALYLFRGEFPRSTSFANRGLEMLRSRAAAKLRPERRAYHALNLHSVAGHILLRQFEYDRSIEEFQRGLKFSESIGSLSNTALILNNLGIAYHQSNRLQEALRVYRRAAALATRMGDETAHFSIQCNVATIRARQGALRAARDTFEAIEEMPHTHRSTRARLFYLHSRGLLDRLSLDDARGLWEESIRLADTLSDPLFASYGRVYLLENEIFQGRWGSARKTVETLRQASARDSHLGRAISSRRVLLEALCGNHELARGLADDYFETYPAPRESVRKPSHALLWDDVLIATALVELDDTTRAERILARTKRRFDRTRQPAGSLECALLLAELALRGRDGDAAARWIQEARRAMALHDRSEGSRLASARIPFLEARLVLLRSPRRSSGRIAVLLTEAAGHLHYGTNAEIAWLVDLLRAEVAESGAHARLPTSRARFAGGLGEEDRKRYLSIDHRVRLGLAAAGEESDRDAAVAMRERGSTRRFDVLLQLRAATDVERALELVLEGAGARRGAVFVEDRRRTAAARGLRGLGRAEVDAIRGAALRIGSGTWARGLCVELRRAPRGRHGVLYVELPGDRPPAERDELVGFLELASGLISAILDRAGPPRPATDSTPSLRGRSQRTQTLLEMGLAETQSPGVQELLTLVRRTRDSNLPVLLTGESGTGKDHMARWIHALSPRRDRPFIGQDLSAIPENLIEADLFGHEEGAFTGASRARRGYLLAADGGTFYLDNVDSLSLEMQAKILGVLEDERVRPLGARAATKINVRFMASTKRDLKELCARGEFRNDLYFRLAGICLNLPRLRERPEDIPHLIRHFQRQIPGGGPTFAPEALEVLTGHSWPGNVRELESVVRRLALTAEEPVGESEARRVLGLEETPRTFPRWVFEGREYDQLLADFKREYLLYLFDRFEGDFDRIAGALGTTKRNAYLRFSQAGLKPVDLRRFSQRG